MLNNTYKWIIIFYCIKFLWIDIPSAKSYHDVLNKLINCEDNMLTTTFYNRVLSMTIESYWFFKDVDLLPLKTWLLEF